jgi:hypothetical protein
MHREELPTMSAKREEPPTMSAQREESPMSLVASGRYVIFHAGVEAGVETWSIVPGLTGGGAIARGEQRLFPPHPLPSELGWWAQLSPEGRLVALEAEWRVGTRTVRAEHAADGETWRGRIRCGGHTREQSGDFPAFAEVAFGSHVLHTIMLRRYELRPGAEHEFPALLIGPPFFGAEPGRQRLTCTEVRPHAGPRGTVTARRVEISDPAGGVPAFAAWLDEHDVILESYEDVHSAEPWMRLVEYERG